jgi:hypothetical protein
MRDRKSWAIGSSGGPSWLLGRVWSCCCTLACALYSFLLAAIFRPPSFCRYHVQCVLHSTLLSLLTRQWHLDSRGLHRWWRSRVAGDSRGRLHRRGPIRRARGEEGSASGAEGHERRRGFGYRYCQSRSAASFRGGGDKPRRVIEAADLVVENMIATDTKESRRGRSGEGRCGVAVEESRSCIDEVGAAKCLAEID